MAWANLHFTYPIGIRAHCIWHVDSFIPVNHYDMKNSCSQIVDTIFLLSHYASETSSHNWQTLTLQHTSNVQTANQNQLYYGWGTTSSTNMHGNTVWYLQHCFTDIRHVICKYFHLERTSRFALRQEITYKTTKQHTSKQHFLPRTQFSLYIANQMGL